MVSHKIMLYLLRTTTCKYQNITNLLLASTVTALRATGLKVKTRTSDKARPSDSVAVARSNILSVSSFGPNFSNPDTFNSGSQRYDHNLNEACQRIWDCDHKSKIILQVFANIKLKDRITDAAVHIFDEIRLTREHCQTEEKKVIFQSIQHNAFMANPESMVLTMIGRYFERFYRLFQTWAEWSILTQKPNNWPKLLSPPWQYDDYCSQWVWLC